VSDDRVLSPTYNPERAFNRHVSPKMTRQTASVARAKNAHPGTRVSVNPGSRTKCGIAGHTDTRGGSHPYHPKILSFESSSGCASVAGSMHPRHPSTGVSVNPGSRTKCGIALDTDTPASSSKTKYTDPGGGFAPYARPAAACPEYANALSSGLR